MNTLPNIGHRLSREAAESIARNWWMVLVNGLALVVAGVLVFSIDWSVRSLATFIGALFILEGVSYALTTGFGARVRQGSVVAGLLSIAAGVVIIVWPGPGLTALAIVLGSWLIVVGTLTITGAFAARRIMSNWWLLLIMGLLEVPLGVLALADPGATLAAIVTVGGIWAVAVGVTRIVFAFEVRKLPEEVDKAWTAPATNVSARPAVPAPAPTAVANGR